MAFPLFPIVVGAVVLTACVKAATSSPQDRKIYSLDGSEWGTDPTSDQYVQFRTGGEISGFGGCNNFFGTYDLNGTKLTVGPLASTKKMCPNNIDSERNFIKALQNSRRIDASHFNLKLYGPKDELLLDLKRRDWD